MEEPTRDRQERVASNQSMWREINELALTNKREDSFFRTFVCECAAENCVDAVSLSEEEYNGVRKHPDHFFVKPGHVYLDVVRIVKDAGGGGSRYHVVEKLGAAGQVAVERDPRAPS